MISGTCAVSSKTKPQFATWHRATGAMLEPVIHQEVPMGVKTMKRRVFAGAVCEQYVYNMPEGVKNAAEYDPEKARRIRFKDEAERLKHREEISRRTHVRNFHANFCSGSMYSTLTFDDDWEVHTFQDAKRIRKNFVRAIQRRYPDAVVFLYMGRGKGTDRIHFHMVSNGVPQEFLDEKWKYGSVKRFSQLREHNWYDGVDHGQDYTGLANYLFDHWTEEVGGHRWFQTKNAKKPDVEQPKEVRVIGGYSEKRPPVAPKGYKLVETKITKYGYMYFKYVVIPPKYTRGKKRKEKPGDPD